MIVPDYSEPPAILGFGFALVILGIAIGFALRPWRGADRVRASWGVRVIAPSLLFSISTCLFFAILFAGTVSLSRMALGLIVLTGMALAYVAVFELIARLMRARPVPGWLIAASLSFTLPLLLSITANSGMAALLSYDAFVVVIFGSASALLWWSLLTAPAPPPDSVFD